MRTDYNMFSSGDGPVPSNYGTGEGGPSFNVGIGRGHGAGVFGLDGFGSGFGAAITIVESDGYSESYNQSRLFIEAML